MTDAAFSATDEAFRTELRAFIASELDPAIRLKVARGETVTKPEHQAWHRRLAERGWLAPNWPREYGGAGWNSVWRFIFDEETALGDCPRGNVAAIDLLGPLVVAFGTEEQKRRFLPPILASDDWWCQGFSEPGAGSDLASLKTKAVRDGHHYIVTGTKLWTSHAQHANWMFALVRTSVEEKKQAGISYLLFPMDSPGVVVSPIITLGGVHLVNQVFLDDVRVPAENLLGEEGNAWRMTGYLLGFERLVGAGVGVSQRMLQQLRTAAADEPFRSDRAFQDRVAILHTDVLALKLTAHRVLAAEMAGAPAGPEVSVLKLKGAQVQQELAELIMEVAGPLALVIPDSASSLDLPECERDLLHAAVTYLDRRKLSIYGGSSEIQRNIISRRILNIRG
jgi:alkylation response protein AidB-like acyl-CoA dehydrogenase